MSEQTTIEKSSVMKAAIIMADLEYSLIKNHIPFKHKCRLQSAEDVAYVLTTPVQDLVKEICEWS